MKKFLVISFAAALSLSALNADVLAKAGNITVTDEDIAPFLKPQINPVDGTASNTEISAEEKKKIIDDFIKYKLLVDTAKASGIEKDPNYKKQVELAKEAIVFNLWQDKEYDKIQVSDEEAKKIYDENLNNFVKPEQVSASHILVDDNKTANDIIAKLNSFPQESLKTEFEKIAKEQSKDPTAKDNGGNLGTFGRGMMVSEFEQAVFALNDGQITKEPVKTQFGYHVIYKDSSSKAEPIPFDNVKDMIKNQLKGPKLGKMLEDKANELFAKQKVTYTK